MKISPKIFRMYDIRGIYGEDLKDETAKVLGKAIGTFFDKYQVKRIVIGRDNRLSGPKLINNLIKGLKSSGRKIVDVGIITSPMMYFSWHYLHALGTIMVTASHNPAEYNGFKIALNAKPIYGEKYQEIRKIAEKGEFSQGKGGIEKYHQLQDAYLQEIIEKIKIKRKLKIIVDCGNGTTSFFVKKLFEGLGCQITPLFCQSDGSFPNHPPYPQKVEFYSKLRKTIKKEGADLGLAFDGDGDRIGVYDENGNFIPNDILLLLFARDICKKNPGRKIIGNVSTSLSVLEDIKKHGGKPMLWKTGYPFIAAKMKEEKAIFGGEISGHFFFIDRYYGFDDALYAAARFLEIVGNSNKPLSQLLTNIPAYFRTPEFRVKAKDKVGTIKKIIRDIKNEYPQAKILDIDGIRFSFKNRWGLIRASNTEPLLSGRAEAKTKAGFKKMKDLIQAKLAKYGVKLDWQHPIE